MKYIGSYLYKIYTVEKYTLHCEANTRQRPKQGYFAHDTENSSQSHGQDITV